MFRLLSKSKVWKDFDLKHALKRNYEQILLARSCAVFACYALFLAQVLINLSPYSF